MSNQCFSFGAGAAALLGCLLVPLGCASPVAKPEADKTTQQSAKTSAAVRDIDPRAAEVLKRMSETLKNATTFKFRAITFSDEMLPSGLTVQHDKAGEITVRRPDGLRLEFTKRGDKRLLVYDGTTVTLADLERNFYATRKAPSDLDAVLDMLQERLGLTMPMADLIFSDPYNVLTERAMAGSYLGKTSILGTGVHHLIFSQPGLDWQIWIEDTERALPRRMVLTYVEEEGQPRYTVTLSNWELEPALSDETFVYAPAEGAEQIEFLPVTRDQE